MSSNLPTVISENTGNTNCRMILSISIIIIVCLLIINTGSNRVCKDISESVSTSVNNTYVHVSPNKYYVSNPVQGQYIIIKNVNKKKLPINKIVVIGTNRQLYPLEREQSTIKKICDYGISFTFKLPMSVTISQIVIDINPYYQDQKNMRSAQVEIRDSNFKQVWQNTKQLNIESGYIFVYIQKPKIVEGDPQQVLCDGSLNCAQENVLNFQLQRDIWR
jgi:hypothetical protein